MIVQYLGIASLLIGLATVARWFQLAVRVEIPKKAGHFQLLWAAGLVLGVLALYLDASLAIAYWGVGVAIVMLYLSLTGAQKVAEQAVQVGDLMPSFNSLDDSGASFESSSLAGSRVLIKFFRGHW